MKSKDIFLSSFAKRNKVFKRNLEKHDFFDFIRLSDIDEIMAGMVPIPAANILGDEIQYYSPDSYLRHLKNVEYLLKHYGHYHVIIEDNNEKEEQIIYVKEDYAVIITRASNPFVIFDVAEYNLIRAFTENLRRKIPYDVFEIEYRKGTLLTLQTLIAQIEERMTFLP